MADLGIEREAAVFAGGGGPDLKRAAAIHLADIKERGREAQAATDALNVLWSAADVGALLVKEGWSVITGGYYMGPMGMVSKAAYQVSRKSGGRNKPVGAVFVEHFPDDPLTIKGNRVDVGNLSQRQEMFFERARAFFFMGGGRLGTLSEVFGAMKDDGLREEIRKFGVYKDGDNLAQRVFIVVDPTEKMQKLLTLVFEEYIGVEKARNDEIIKGITERMFVFGTEAFDLIGNQEEYPGLMRLTRDSKDGIGRILGDHWKNLK